jgi:hypothetical protein
VVFSGIKVIPVYVNAYELDDYIRTQTPYWLTQRVSSDAVRNSILAKARDLNLPISAEQVKVEATGGRVTVSLDYTVPVNLIVYTLQLHFAPSAENKQIA